MLRRYLIGAAWGVCFALIPIAILFFEFRVLPAWRSGRWRRRR